MCCGMPKGTFIFVHLSVIIPSVNWTQIPVGGGRGETYAQLTTPMHTMLFIDVCNCILNWNWYIVLSKCGRDQVHSM